MKTRQSDALNEKRNLETSDLAMSTLRDYYAGQVQVRWWLEGSPVSV
jgi:hypothetical protein